MSVFGDFEDADAYDTAPADPEQVAIRLHQYEGGVWDDLTADQRAARVQIIVRLFAWLRRQGALR